MRILQINSVCGYGSTGRIVFDLQKEIENSGFEGLVCYGRGSAPEECNAYKFANKLDFYIHCFLARITDKSGLYSKKATLNLINKIKEYKPDIIHLHNIHGYYLNYEILFSFLNNYNVPIVWTLHDCWSFTGHCAYFSAKKCLKWQTECKNCAQLNNYPKSFKDNSENNFNLKEKLFKNTTKLTIVTPSEWLKKEVEHSFLKNHKTVVINNGIDTEIFKPTDSQFKEKNNLKNKKIILGVASIWEERKGLNDFLNLSEILPQNYEIVLVGTTEKQKKEISGKNVKNNILCINRTDSVKELAEIYSAADVFVNTTYEDNYPTTNLEALCCGTPVITYNTGGSPECIKLKDGFGEVTEPGDINGLLNCIINIENVCKKEEILNFRSNFDKTVCFKKYIELYKGILADERD